MPSLQQNLRKQTRGPASLRQTLRTQIHGRRDRQQAHQAWNDVTQQKGGRGSVKGRKETGER